MEEDLNFLTIMDKVLPITDEEWSRVFVKHNSSNPDINWIRDRNEEQIHCQFFMLYQKCAQTSDPNCPENG